MDRDQLILSEIVEAYLDSGEAVGSKTIADRLEHSLSAASIRAVMLSLGQRGLLTQSHTSSGRIPTDRGYRAYLEHLGPHSLSPRDRAKLAKMACRDGASPQEHMREVAACASGALGAATLVLAPRLEHARLRQIKLISLRTTRILALLVTESGFVHERLLFTEHPLEPSELERFSNYLNTFVPGLSLSQARVLMHERLQAERDALADSALSLAQRALELSDEPADLCIEGAGLLLAQREFQASPDVAAALISSLETRELWLSLFKQVEDAEDVRVYVGEEAPKRLLNACGVVLTRWKTEEATGVIAVLGPRRLDYRRAIPLVASLGRRLGELIDPSTPLRMS